MLVLLAVSVTVFVLIRMIPGDPVRLMLSIEATDEDVERFRQELGYDKPIYHQYIIYLNNIVKGDLGASLRARRPVTEMILERMPATFELAFAATIISVLIAVPLGTVAAYKRGTIFDRFFMFLTMIGQSMPIFWLGILLIILFSVQLGWLPTSGRGSFSQLLLPAITLSTFFMALIARMTPLFRSGGSGATVYPDRCCQRPEGTRDSLCSHPQKRNDTGCDGPGPAGRNTSGRICDYGNHFCMAGDRKTGGVGHL